MSKCVCQLVTHLVMFVKDTLEEEVSVVVELCGAVRRNLDPEMKRQTDISFQS